ncbi:MAG: hypothetical protein HY819_16385 [Acidobacteria bacterium]|nr:hypothetical protein [Acidobacteriota bacterium]
MNDNQRKLTLAETQKRLSEILDKAPDKETLVEWVKLGYLIGEESDSEIYISKESLDTLLEQLQKSLETKREARLILHAVDVWRREEDRRAIAVTLASKTSVVTTEKLCKDNVQDMLTASAQATLDAINEILGNKFFFELLQVKHHSLSKIEQSMVAILLKVGRTQDSMQTLSGVAMAENDTLPLQAASRATLNALNRTISPFVPPQSTWRELFRKFLPV